MTPQVIFRELQRSDFRPLHIACWPDQSRAYVEMMFRRAFTLQNRRRGGARVAVVNDRPCGFGLITLWSQVAEISDLVVCDDLRGFGIGTGLLAELGHLAESLGSKTLEIGARVNNTRAIALYERVGFTTNRTIHMRLSAGVEDIVYLQKSIE